MDLAVRDYSWSGSATLRGNSLARQVRISPLRNIPSMMTYMKGQEPSPSERVNELVPVIWTLVVSKG